MGMETKKREPREARTRTTHTTRTRTTRDAVADEEEKKKEAAVEPETTEEQKPPRINPVEPPREGVFPPNYEQPGEPSTPDEPGEGTEPGSPETTSTDSKVMQYLKDYWWVAALIIGFILYKKAGK